MLIGLNIPKHQRIEIQIQGIRIIWEGTTNVNTAKANNNHCQTI